MTVMLSFLLPKGYERVSQWSGVFIVDGGGDLCLLLSSLW